MQHHPARTRLSPRVLDEAEQDVNAAALVDVAHLLELIAIHKLSAVVRTRHWRF
jgi:hypothetical protein